MSFIARLLSKLIVYLTAVTYSSTVLCDRVPGGPEWWGSVCSDQNNQLYAALAAAESALNLTISSLPSWQRSCLDLIEPDAVAICLAEVESIEISTLAAKFSVEPIGSSVASAEFNTNEAVVYAKAKNIGGQAQPANPLELVMLTGINVKVANSASVVAAQGALMVGAAERAYQSAIGIRLVIPDTEVKTNTGRIVAGTLAQTGNAVCTCYLQVVMDILVKAAFGFGNGFQFPGGPGPGDSDTSDSTWVPAHPLSTPQARAYYWSNPMVMDLSTIDPYLLEGSRVEYGDGHVHRSWISAYVLPRVVLSEDIIGREPFTLLPITLARAGTPIVVERQTIEGSARVDVYPDRIALIGGVFDLFYRMTDAEGNPLDEKWVRDESEESTPWFKQTPAGIRTTGSPEQIARGEMASKYMEIRASNGIVDPLTGEDVPGERWSGYWLHIRAPYERPQHPCWEWSESQQKYVWPLGCT